MANRTFDDRQIGKQAAAKLNTVLRSKTSGFADHVNRPEGKKSLKDAKAVARLKKYGLISNGTRSHYLRAISIVMPKHGFIRHYGVNRIRAAGERNREKPRSFKYHYRSHQMKQTEKPFLDSVIRSSGVVEFVAEKIAEARGEEVAQHVAVSIRNFH